MGHTSSEDIDCHLRKYGSCEGLHFYREYEGVRYCVLHLPSEDKKEDFKEAVDTKLRNKDFKFRGATFPSDTALFDGHVFEEADFTEATFKGKVNFSGTTFWNYPEVTDNF